MNLYLFNVVSYVSRVIESDQLSEVFPLLFYVYLWALELQSDISLEFFDPAQAGEVRQRWELVSFVTKVCQNYTSGLLVEVWNLEV